MTFLKADCIQYPEIALMACKTQFYLLVLI